MNNDAKDESPAGWAGRVEFSDEGFAYRPGELLVGGQRGLDEAKRLYPSFRNEEAIFPGRETGQVFRLRGEADPAQVAHELRLEGVVAQPNHVLFAHCECCCGPHPALRFGADVQGSPFHASPFHASPFHASPFHASELQENGRCRSSARPADPPRLTSPVYDKDPHPPRVVVLDTGFADATVRPGGLAWIQPAPENKEWPDEDQEGYLDPAGGHGTFISGLIEQLVRGCDILPQRVLSTMGDGDEATIATAIDAIGAAGDCDLLSLSFGGYALERMYVLEAALRRVQSAGTVVVASAGNDSTCSPTYPAALPGVIGVGALGPSGPAPFTNYGRWVRACAPGVDLVAPFFDHFNGVTTPAGDTDPDDFRGWARWSGTSFAAPVVVAALAREMRLSGVDAKQAVARVIDAPGLLRIPDLGTVVNLQ